MVIFFLAGCMPPESAFSPEQAAMNFAASVMSEGAAIDPSSFFVRQKVEWNDQATMVLISFTRQAESRQESCLMMYEVRKTTFGLWHAGSGGGGCAGKIGQDEFDPGQPLEIGGGQHGGSTRTDPGFSHVAGLVHQDAAEREFRAEQESRAENESQAEQESRIEQVRVTWDDGEQQTVSVVNDSYLALRAGKFGWNSVEGLNAAGEVVYGAPAGGIAPGKAP